MADYSLLGSFSTGGASALNGELLTKLKDADREAALFHIDKQLENITGLDAESGDALDALGESDRMTLIKAQTADLMAQMSSFDLNSSSVTSFDSVSASTTGTSAVFDAVDVSGLEPGTNNIDVTQLAQRDVFQSYVWTEAEKDGVFPIISSDAGSVDVDGDGDGVDSDDADNLALVKSSKLSVEVDGTTYDFNIFKDLTVGTIAELDDKTLTELAAEINENDKLIASVESVGSDQFRLVIKSTESGTANGLTISQTNIDIGFGLMQSDDVDFTTPMGAGKITINGEVVMDDTDGKSYDELITAITDYSNNGFDFTATRVGDSIKIISNDGSAVTVVEEGSNGLNFSDTSHTLKAQNLQANVDGVDYDVDSNTLTIQGNLTMTAVELGKSTINITKDTSAILSGIESFLSSYNALVDLIDAEVADTDSPIYDLSALKSVTSGIKDKLFSTYGLSGDKSLFNYGLDLDLKGHLSMDSSKFADALVDNYDDIKNLFLGNTTDTDLAASDSTKYMGMGTLIKSYLDDLDGYDGVFTRYETNMTSRQEKLEKDREEAIKSLDSKYQALGAQYALYGSAISTMESSFSGLSMMIEQSVASK